MGFFLVGISIEMSIIQSNAPQLCVHSYALWIDLNAEAPEAPNVRQPTKHLKVFGFYPFYGGNEIIF